MTERRVGKKRKAMDEKVLTKARNHIPLPSKDEEDEDDFVPTVTEEEIQNILTPHQPLPKKVRKPRHTEKKVKEVQPEETPKKKTKKKRKKKTKGTGEETGVKNQESTNRHTLDALEFLQKWKQNRSEWKFEKLKQSWLLHNCLDPQVLPDASFPLLLEYMASVKGQARTVTEREMDVAMKAFEEKENPLEGDRVRYDRAREVLQMLGDG
jgi:hypothetical protein